MSNRRPALVALATLIVAVAAGVVLYADADEQPRAPTTNTTVERPTPGVHSELPTISSDELPSAAVEMLALIDQGGPFPYPQDGGIFQNREALLPDRGETYYREYTVATPGSADRGARRIVAGAEGERYYTDDHYESFREILLDGGADG